MASPAKARGRIDWTLWIILVLCVGVALTSYRYLVPGAPGGSPEVLANSFTRLGVLTVHAGLAATALILGPFQFMAGVRRKHAALHRRMGTAYVICCLAGAVAGFVLALGTTAGPIATAGFGALGILWFAATAQAWRMARARRIDAHERWMMRSFALTLAAVTLRLYLPAGFLIKGVSFMEAYRVISFACWVPNLIIVEWLIARRRVRTSSVREAVARRSD